MDTWRRSITTHPTKDEDGKRVDMRGGKAVIYQEEQIESRANGSSHRVSRSQNFIPAKFNVQPFNFGC